jgi:hypothetical protein
MVKIKKEDLKMNNLFDYIKEIKEENNIRITSFAEMDDKNKKFLDFEYFTIEKENLFFYIQKSYFGGYEITTYKKINFNKKQQLFYPVIFNNKNDLLKIINEHVTDYKKRNMQPLKNTYEQTIYHELLTYKHYNGKYQILFNHLKDVAGFREKEILQNIDFVEMKLNNKNYFVLEFYNKTGQSFAINTKNINSLIVN